MSDFDLSLTGTIVLADRIIERGHVAVRDGKIALVGEGAGGVQEGVERQQ